MLDDSNVDIEHLGMTKMRMMTDGYIQTHHQYSVIQIQLNGLCTEKKTCRCQTSRLLLVIRATCPIVPNQRAMTLKPR